MYGLNWFPSTGNHLKPTGAMLYFARLATIPWIALAFIISLGSTAFEMTSWQVSGQIISVEDGRIDFEYSLSDRSHYKASQSFYFFSKPIYYSGQTVTVAVSKFDPTSASIKGLRNVDCGYCGLLFLGLWYILSQVGYWLAFRNRTGKR